MEKNKIYHKNLKIVFWTNLIILVLAILFLLKLKGPDFQSSAKDGIVYERYAIIFTLIGIPLVLRLCHKQFKKILNSEINKSMKYVKLSLLRLAGLNLIIIFNLIGFYLYESTNFIYMSIILMFALIFSHPNRSYWVEIEESEKKENNK